MDRDHTILHQFIDNPASATTSHALVKNDMYGLPHTLAYEQFLLTPAQIRDAHDMWVAEYEPQGHTTPIQASTTKEKAHIDRWDEVVIINPTTKRSLTKRDVYRYYSNPNVKKKLFGQIQNQPVLMRQAMNPGDFWIKRSPVIRKNVNNENDPEDIQYYISRRHLEFHPTIKSLTGRLVIDLDAGKDVKLDDVKKVALYLEKLLGNQTYIKDIDFQFSGNKGFYVWGYLTMKQDVDKLREKLKMLLNPISVMNGVKVTLRQSPGRNTVRLDLSPMKRLGSVRAESSLDSRTGYISVKVLSSQLVAFDPELDASIDISKLKPVYSIRDEELI